MLCYAVDDEKSLHDLQEKVLVPHPPPSPVFNDFVRLRGHSTLQWIVEASRIELKRVSRILVGCKTDLRNDPGVLDAAKNAGKRMLTPEDVSITLSFSLSVGG
jgi:hypothetical protein